VRIEGPVELTDAQESDDYFASRPHGSQIGARASRQSEVAADRAELDARIAEVRAEYEGRAVPRPLWWGGVRIVPRSYEFWQHRDDRLHDRLRYTPDGAGWRIERLQP
jgi:pyridoxamine 5'-phosphate oxidase